MLEGILFYCLGTFITITTITVMVSLKRNSVMDSSLLRPITNSSNMKRLSINAKRVSESFIGMISKAYHSKTPEPDYDAMDFFSNPMKSHITAAVTKMRTAVTTAEMVESIRSLGHISITGGNETSGYIGKFVIPDLCQKLANQDELYEIKLACVSAISELCAFCMKDNQDLCRESGALIFLLEGIQPHSNNKELLMRQMCAHALYYCIADHNENKTYVLHYNIWLNLKNLSHYMHPDETMWEFNDADMILDMLRR